MKKNMFKKIMLLTFAFILVASGIQKVSAASPDSRFPDQNFYNCVVKNVGQNNVESNGRIKDSALKNITRFSCGINGNNIKDTTGLNLMTNLKELYLCNENLAQKGIDLSKNTKLQYLELGGVECRGNKLKSIDLSKNTNLTSLSLSGNNLKSLDLSKNTKLTSLDLEANYLKSINLSKNTKLTTLDLSYNYFTSKPSKCTQLSNKCYFGYIVKFNSNGGSSVATQNDGYWPRKPADPKRNGYKFLGWYKGNNSYDFHTGLTGDITLTAKWQQLLTQEGENNDGLNKTTITIIAVGLAAIVCLGLMSSRKPTKASKTTAKRRTTKSRSTAAKPATKKRK